MNNENSKTLDSLRRLIETKQAEKAARRRSFSLRLMKNYAGLYNCRDCFYSLTNSCIDNLPNGCEYFFDAQTGRQFQKRATI